MLFLVCAYILPLMECFLRTGHDVVGKVHVKQIYEIARAKQKDAHLSHIGLESLCRSIMASAGSMGIEIVK